MTDAERIRYLEESIRELRKEKENLKKEKGEYRHKILNIEEENKKLKETIKRLEFDVDAWHQLKLLLEWEIGRLRWLQICWKTVAERIEDDKKVVRE